MWKVLTGRLLVASPGLEYQRRDASLNFLRTPLRAAQSVEHSGDLTVEAYPLEARSTVLEMGLDLKALFIA
jgi:hypothetical protein